MVAALKGERLTRRQGDKQQEFHTIAKWFTHIRLFFWFQKDIVHFLATVTTTFHFWKVISQNGNDRLHTVLA